MYSVLFLDSLAIDSVCWCELTLLFGVVVLYMLLSFGGMRVHEMRGLVAVGRSSPPGVFMEM